MAHFVCTWWEYVRDAKDEIVMSPLEGHPNVSSPRLRNIATGEVKIGRELPTGALWAAERRDNIGPNDYPPVGKDGLSVMCRHTDGHSWNIDARASNCTKKDDNEHRCWVRHGTVGEKLTVDKNGNTCAAGAGSFFMGPNNEWHGFLRDGVLKQC